MPGMGHGVGRPVTGAVQRGDHPIRLDGADRRCSSELAILATDDGARSHDDPATPDTQDWAERGHGTIKMPRKDPYRQNPAREVERYACRVVREWVGAGGVLTDISSGHGPDFRIEYADGRRAVGEVGWHADPKLQAMWAEVFKRERHQVIELPEGAGQWMVTLVPGASINRLYDRLPAFVWSLVEEGHVRLDIHGDWPRGDPADTARQLGIEHITRVERKAPAVAVFFLGGGMGEIVPTDPNVVTDWVDGVLASPEYSDTTGKLLALEADERHVFLMSGDRTPFGADERLRRLEEALPDRAPQIPPGISHVWVVPQFGGAVAGLWAVDGGWSTERLPDGW